MKQYDEKLRKVKKICLNYDICSIDTFDNKIYCLSKDTASSSLHIYDNKLVNLNSINCNLNEPFYLPFSIDKVQVCESFLVFRDDMEIMWLYLIVLIFISLKFINKNKNFLVMIF